MHVMNDLMRHIDACNNAILPGARLPVRVVGETVGWVLPDVARQAGGAGAELEIPPDRLQTVARTLADAGACRWRDEAFDVRARPDGRVLGQIDRGALPALGIQATGVHVNGLVGDRLWVAHRALDKALDPGKLDHVVAGGIPAGHTPEQTLVKEAAEEAAIPADLARQARPVGSIAYAMERHEGLRRDLLHCYDLELPAAFEPHPQDGEVSHFELWPLDRALETVRRTDRFKFNVALVLIDLFLRRDMLPAAEAALLRAALGGTTP